MENNNEERKKAQTVQSKICELSVGLENLENMVSVYKSLICDRISLSTETKKAVQSSILELCTVISELVKED